MDSIQILWIGIIVAGLMVVWSFRTVIALLGITAVGLLLSSLTAFGFGLMYLAVEIWDGFDYIIRKIRRK